MRNLIYIILFLYSSLVYGNCELQHAGFHTIADYLNEDSFKNSESYPLSFQLSNTFGRIKYNQLRSSLEAEPLKKLVYEGQECTIESMRLDFTFFQMPPYLRFPICFKDKNRVQDYSDVKALFNTKKQALIIPRETELIPYPTIPEAEKANIENRITKFLEDKNFRGTIGHELKRDEYKISGFDHFIYDGTKTIVTSLKAESNELNPELKVNFEIVFMSVKDVSWYFADSSFINPCKRESISGTQQYKEMVEYYKSYPDPHSKTHLPQMASQEDMRFGQKNSVALFKYGWVYGNSDFPQIIEFDSDYSRNSYLVDFNKGLTILHESSYREIMSNHKEIGLQKEVLKQK